MALRIIAVPLRCLPYRVALSLAWILAWMIFFVFGYRRTLAVSRVLSVFSPDITRRRALSIAWHSWRNTLFNAVDMLRMPLVSPAWLESHFDMDEFLSVLKKHAATGKGAILAAPHLGSWEMAAVASRLHNLPVFSVTGRQKNALVDDFIQGLRQSHGIPIIPRGSGTLREILRRLAAGEYLAILPDLRHPTPDVPVQFLRGAANVSGGMASFARHADVPIFPCIVLRDGWTRHSFHIHPPVWPDKSLDKKQDVEKMTRTVLEIMDKAVQDNPGQWFWFNKRWILDPIEQNKTTGVK
jgi:Kdo2-lipid IVA lauroyltransferase/acyltransferase